MSEVIFAYTRKQALEDGVLLDVSKLAEEAGFLFPVAVTSAVWERCVAVPRACPWQDETGRLWDILQCLRFAVRREEEGSCCQFSVMVQNDHRGARAVKVKSLCHAGDRGEPVITIMVPEED